jgi:hypothetical protein
MEIEQKRFAHGAWSLIGLAAAALALAGCGGSGGGSAGMSTANPTVTPSACADCGTLMVGLTDADGDFVSYSVDVLSIKLQRANGAQIETLPQTTRIDFAQLTDLSDLLSVASLAPGDFVKGSIRLDYTNADIEVQKGTDSVKATAVDGSGNPLGVTELEVRLDGKDHLVITKGRATFLAVDFNLAASNSVDLTQTTPVVTVQPFIVASVQPVDQKDLRVRGPLVSVDTTASSYVVNVRPWFVASGDHGEITVHTSATTSFEIDGAASTGADGLKALAAEAAGTLTLAIGTLDTSTRDFTANTVFAGTSVPGEGLDAVQGNVVSRTGDTLTVKGAFAVHRDHQLDFQRTVLVTVGANTKVTMAGSTDAVDASAISVGQSIVALGTLSAPASAGGTMAPTPATPIAPATLDATAGRVRLQPTELHGAVKTVVPGTLTLQLRSIDRLGIAMFNFAGTGSATASDADPNNYEVQTGNLSLASLSAGEAAKVIGFVTPFGSAPPDFVGATVVDHLDLPSTLGIGWGATGTTAPFVSMSATGLVIDITNKSIGERHFILSGMQKLDILTLASGPTIAPTTDRGMYGVWEPGHVELFEHFADFETKLAARLAAGDAITSMTAFGAYDAGSNTLTANGVSAFFGKVDATMDDSQN